MNETASLLRATFVPRRLRFFHPSHLAFGLAGLVGLTGCQARVDGPAMTLTAIDSPIVCTSIPSTLTISGTGLAPLPVGTLSPPVPDGGGGSGTVKLAFPRISVLNTTSLAGVPVMAAMPVKIPDDPDHPDLSAVRWTSSTSIGFTVTKELMLPQGVYSVVVTTPATPDIQTATLDPAFVAVPAPSIKSIATDMGAAAACNSLDASIVITGANFIQVGNMAGGLRPKIHVTAPDMTAKDYDPAELINCTPVPNKIPSLAGLQTCTEMHFPFPKSAAVGTYKFVVVQAGAGGCSSDPMSMSAVFKVTGPPSITSVAPPRLCGNGGPITITGKNFVTGAKVEVGGQGTIAAPVVNMAGTSMVANFSGDTFTPGQSYDVVVTNPDGCAVTSAKAVIGVAGPTVFFVDPPAALAGISTPFSIYASAIMGQAMTVTVRKSGAMITSDAAGMTDPKHPLRVLATVPKTLGAGQYDILVTDGSGCPTIIPMGLTLYDKPTLPIASVAPPIGVATSPTFITINAAGGFVATPRVYLSPKGASARATELLSVAFQSATQIAAVVPAGLDPAAGPYDVVVVNSDGTAGQLAAGFIVNAKPVPRIDALYPSAIPANNAADIVIRGGDFRMPTVSLTCNDANMTVVPPQTPKNAGAVSIVLGAPSLAMLTPGTSCTVRVVNGDDKSYVDYAALFITGAAGSPALAKGSLGNGPPLVTARRAPGLSSAWAGSSSRYLYAVGGDGGTSAGALDSVESVAVSGTGPTGNFVVQRSKLLAKRTLAGVAAAGRYLYAVGGNDGTSPIATVERAMILDPAKTPAITDTDLKLGGAMGVGAGSWVYRIAAIFDPMDADNPNGESLASPPVIVRVPMVMGMAQVVLGFTPVTGAIGYRVYRTPMPNMPSGGEALLDMLAANVLTFTDDGTKMAMGALPLAPGSTGSWRAMPTLGTPRESAAVTIAADPNDPTKLYLYALGGRGPMNALASYEFLAILVAADGTHTAAKSFTAGMMPLAPPRYQATASAGSSDLDSAIPAATSLVYLLGGTTNGMTGLPNVDVATVAAGGDLGSFTATGATLAASFGSGSFTAGNNLFLVGSDRNAKQTQLGAIPAMGMGQTVGNFAAAGTSLQTGRYLPGVALVGGTFLVAGGSDSGLAGATTSTEWMVY